MTPDFLPMEALSVASLPTGKNWVYEPKWDGFRCLASKDKKKISLTSKSGKPLERYFPEIVEMLKAIKAEKFILDGELVIFTDGKLSFSDLQLRLHPSATRINKLAQQTPASFIMFDILTDSKGKQILDQPFSARRAELEKFHGENASQVSLQISPQVTTIKAAEKWLHNMKGTIDGIVAKNREEIYQPGERIMQKYKPVKTADCVVGGFRYGTNSKLVGSLLLGLYDEEGKLNHVGFTSSIGAKDKKDLTKKLEALKGGKGFTGKAPGGPSRWSTERTGQWEALKSKMVVEVSFDHVSEERFRHGTKLLRFRDDKAPTQCKMEQLFQN